MGRSTPYFILLGLGLCWGCTIPLTKTAVSTGHEPLGLIFWQLVFSAILLSILVVARRSTLNFDAKHLKFFLIIALVGTVVPNSISYVSATHLPGGVLALIIAMVPMFALLVALTFKLEKFSSRRLLGVTLGMMAIALIVLPESSLPDPAKAVFVVIGLVAPLCYGIESSYISVNQPDDTGPIATIFAASILGALVVLPFTIGTGQFIDLRQGFGLAETALLGSSILHVVAYTGYIWLVGKAGPVFTAQVAYIVTPAGIILSILFLGETPSPYIWGALAILMGGLALVQPRADAGE